MEKKKKKMEKKETINYNQPPSPSLQDSNSQAIIVKDSQTIIMTEDPLRQKFDEDFKRLYPSCLEKLVLDGSIDLLIDDVLTKIHSTPSLTSSEHTASERFTHEDTNDAAIKLPELIAEESCSNPSPTRATKPAASSTSSFDSESESSKSHSEEITSKSQPGADDIPSKSASMVISSTGKNAAAAHPSNEGMDGLSQPAPQSSSRNEAICHSYTGIAATSCSYKYASEHIGHETDTEHKREIQGPLKQFNSAKKRDTENPAARELHQTKKLDKLSDFKMANNSEKSDSSFDFDWDQEVSAQPVETAHADELFPPRKTLGVPSAAKDPEGSANRAQNEAKNKLTHEQRRERQYVLNMTLYKRSEDALSARRLGPLYTIRYLNSE